MKIKTYISKKRTVGKFVFTVVLLLLTNVMVFAQSSGSITVGGNINTFYPVSWYDGNYGSNTNTHLNIGRSNVHLNSEWRGSMVGEFTFHTSNWGNGSHFFDVKLSHNITVTNESVYNNLVGGWTDATSWSSDRIVVIWLRGGGTTYYYSADAAVNPKVYDGVQNALPYLSSNGNFSANVKSTADAYVVNAANNLQLPINVYGTGSNYMQGNLGIGVRNPTEKLAVNGNIRAKEIKVETANWPDYVFEEDYKLPSLQETERFIQANKHLPNIPAARETESEGVSLGEMNRLLLQKVEELTLHLIEKDKEISELKEQRIELEALKKDMQELRTLIQVLKK